MVEQYNKMATDTSKYLLNHTMLRVKEPQRTIKYYEFLGMKLLKKLPNPDAKFDLYFLAFDSPSALSHGHHWTDRQGILELVGSIFVPLSSFSNCWGR